MVRIVLGEPGLTLGRSGDRFVIRRGGNIVACYPASEVEEIVIARAGILVTGAALRLAVERGIDIVILSRRGLPIGLLHHVGLSGFVLIRREQLRAYDDERGVELAKTFIKGKLHGMTYVLLRIGKASKQYNEVVKIYIDRIKPYIIELNEVKGSHIDSVRSRLLFIEAEATKHYWNCIKEIIPGFPGRVHRGARDYHNMCLNYGYSILYGEVLRAILRAGLDPLAGYIHVDRWGRPSLVFDVVEEFRHPIVDLPLFKMFIKEPEVELKEAVLPWSIRKKIIELVNKRLETQVKPPWRKTKPITLRKSILEYCRLIAKYITGMEKEIKPFTLKP